jgi:hypothetical protein
MRKSEVGGVLEKTYTDKLCAQRFVKDMRLDGGKELAYMLEPC